MKDFSPTAEDAGRIDWIKEAPLVMDRARFVDFLEATSPPSLLSRPRIEEILAHADREGIPCRVEPGGRFYHRNYSWNWLFYNQDSFYQACCLGSHQAREDLGLTSEQRGGMICCPEGSLPGSAPRRVLSHPRRV